MVSPSLSNKQQKTAAEDDKLQSTSPLAKVTPVEVTKISYLAMKVNETKACEPITTTTITKPKTIVPSLIATTSTASSSQGGSKKTTENLKVYHPGSNISVTPRVKTLSRVAPLVVATPKQHAKALGSIKGASRTPSSGQIQKGKKASDVSFFRTRNGDSNFLRAKHSSMKKLVFNSSSSKDIEILDYSRADDAANGGGPSSCYLSTASVSVRSNIPAK